MTRWPPAAPPLPVQEQRLREAIQVVAQLHVSLPIARRLAWLRWLHSRPDHGRRTI